MGVRAFRDKRRKSGGYVSLDVVNAGYNRGISSNKLSSVVILNPALTEKKAESARR